MPTKESPPGKAMPTRNVVLTDRQAKFVEKMVASGRYQNASEVMREGLRLVEQQEAENAAKLKALREAVQLGIDDIEAGRYRIFENGDELEAHLKSVASAALNRKRG
jgi:antitoxin ParD1/3/4